MCGTIGFFLLGCNTLYQFILPWYRTLSEFSYLVIEHCQIFPTWMTEHVGKVWHVCMLKTYSVSPAIWSCVIRPRCQNIAIAFLLCLTPLPSRYEITQFDGIILFYCNALSHLEDIFIEFIIPRKHNINSYFV